MDHVDQDHSNDHSTAPVALSNDICAFCGQAFPNGPSRDWLARDWHLTNVHRFGKCDHAQKHFRSDYFRNHLKYSHAAVIGEWTDLLETACMKHEPLDEAWNTSLAKTNALARGSNYSQRKLYILDTYHALQQYAADAYPDIIVDYISLHNLVRSFEGQMHLLSCTPSMEPTIVIKGSHSLRERARNIEQGKTQIGHMLKLREDLEILREEVKKQCTLGAYWLEDIDLFLPPIRCLDKDDCSNLFRNTMTRATASRPNHEDVFEIRRITMNAGLLGNWLSRHDRINRWILHSLRSDHSQAQLHRSMLVDPKVDEKNWARLVLKHWFLDEAATGVELQSSLSNGAIDSRESSLEAADFHTCVEDVGQVSLGFSDVPPLDTSPINESESSQRVTSGNSLPLPSPPSHILQDEARTALSTLTKLFQHQLDGVVEPHDYLTLAKWMKILEVKEKGVPGGIGPSPVTE